MTKYPCISSLIGVLAFYSIKWIGHMIAVDHCFRILRVKSVLKSFSDFLDLRPLNAVNV